MSKLRDNVEITNGEIATPPEGDLNPYVVFTQLKPGGPYLYAGWLDAADMTMALQFAKEHYGQDQQCTRIWAICGTKIFGTDPDHAPSADEDAERTFEVFVQKKAGDGYTSSGAVTATSQAAATEAAIAAHPEANLLLLAAHDDIGATDEDDLIWRYTDQTYRLARGYSQAVRDKWEKIRAERDLTEYEKDDLKECF